MLKTAVGSDDGAIYTVDTIEFEGGLWLVPAWLEAPTEGWRTPARIVRIDTHPHQRLDEPFGPHNVVLNVPVPKAVLDGRVRPTKGAKFEVRDRPALRLPLPGATH